MEDCIFCKIVKGEIPSYKIYEDDIFLSFMDVFPRVKGHTLVIPKKHYRWVYDVPEFGAYWEIVRKVGLAVQKTLGSTYLSFLTVGEEVPHAHIHILPQQKHGVQGFQFAEVVKMNKEEISSLSLDIKNKL